MHVSPAAIDPPENVIDPAPALGENDGEPQPLVVAFGVEATVIAPGDTGNVSVNATPDSGRPDSDW
jgi:hypothetical protein